MQPWFRFYDDAVSDPKVQLLEGELFKTWVNLLCLANKNNGTLPNLKHIAFALRLPEGAVVTAVTCLSQAGLLDRVNATTWAPHNWRGRQYKSDSSAERMRRHRDRHRDRNGDAAVTPPEREKERETERDKTPTEFYPSPEKESAPSQASAQRAAPARPPDGASKQPEPPDKEEPFEHRKAVADRITRELRNAFGENQPKRGPFT
jgi:hypothetical protein